MGLLELFTRMMDYFGRYRIINDRQDKDPYLERYYLFLKDRRSFPFNIFIHKFLKSDPDELHDHPWNYRTFIFRGGYWEYTREGKFWRSPFTYLYRPANSLHRIELDKDKPDCWTLFIPGKKIRDWGFKTEKGWIHNEKYLNEKKDV